MEEKPQPSWQSFTSPLSFLSPQGDVCDISTDIEEGVPMRKADSEGVVQDENEALDL